MLQWFGNLVMEMPVGLPVVSQTGERGIGLKEVWQLEPLVMEDWWENITSKLPPQTCSSSINRRKEHTKEKSHILQQEALKQEKQVSPAPPSSPCAKHTGVNKGLKKSCRCYICPCQLLTVWIHSFYEWGCPNLFTCSFPFLCTPASHVAGKETSVCEW